MVTVKFIRDTNQDREGGSGFVSGDIVDLSPKSAAHWEIRGAIVYVEASTLQEDHDVSTGEDPVESSDADGSGVQIKRRGRKPRQVLPE